MLTSKHFCEETFYIILGPEFGPDEGKLAMIFLALQRLKSASALLHNHLFDCMKQMGYKRCISDPNLWMIPKTRKSDGLEYYDYVFRNVNTVLAFRNYPKEVIKQVDKYFGLKPGLLDYPNIYLS